MSKQNDSIKWCSGCQDYLNRTRFYPDSSRGDGLCPRCIECEKARKNRAYRDNAQYRLNTIAYADYYRRTWYSKERAA
jgi:hypothetical protein